MSTAAGGSEDTEIDVYGSKPGTVEVFDYFIHKIDETKDQGGAQYFKSRLLAEDLEEQGYDTSAKSVGRHMGFIDDAYKDVIDTRPEYKEELSELYENPEHRDTLKWGYSSASTWEGTPFVQVDGLRDDVREMLTGAE